MKIIKFLKFSTTKKINNTKLIHNLALKDITILLKIVFKVKMLNIFKVITMISSKVYPKETKMLDKLLIKYLK